MMKLRLAALLVAALGLMDQATGTVITSYGDRAGWEAAVGTFAAYGFDSAPVTSFPLAGGTIDAGDYSVTVDRQHGVEPGHTGFYEYGGHVIFQTDLHAPGFYSPAFYSFDFDRPIRAFAVDFGGVGDDGGFCPCFGIQVSINGFNFTIPYVNGPQFFGITADYGFSEILFTKPRGEQDYHALSNLSYQFVPEPGSLLMLSFGLAGLAFTRRRKQ